MNLVLITQDDFIDEGEVRLSGRRRDHIVEVLGARAGDVVKVGLLNGPIGVGEISKVEGRAVTLTLALEETPPRPRVLMILAMVRPQIMKRTLQHLASLGVRRIMLIGARRVEPSYFGQRLFDADGYVEHLKLGLEQARDTWLPEVSIHRRFRPFVEDELPRIISEVSGTLRFVAHPGGSDVPRPMARGEAVALAVGPEGGWDEHEVEGFTDAGFSPVKLGPRILKVETAVPYLFGALGL